MGTDSVGWAGNNLFQIQKTTNQGITWGRQTTNANNPSVNAYDSLIAWAGGSGLVKTTDGGGPITYVGIKDNGISGAVIPSFKLNQNYPNPFNPSTTISFEVIKPSYVTLTILDISGRKIAGILKDEIKHDGNYSIRFDTNDHFLSTGIYLYTMTARTREGKEVFIDTKKMMLVR